MSQPLPGVLVPALSGGLAIVDMLTGRIPTANNDRIQSPLLRGFAVLHIDIILGNLAVNSAIVCDFSGHFLLVVSVRPWCCTYGICGAVPNFTYICYTKTEQVKQRKVENKLSMCYTFNILSYCVRSSFILHYNSACKDRKIDFHFVYCNSLCALCAKQC